MPIVELDDAEWQQVMNILIQSHPLLMKIAAQLRAQQPVPGAPNTTTGSRLDGDGKEVRS